MPAKATTKIGTRLPDLRGPNTRCMAPGRLSQQVPSSDANRDEYVRPTKQLVPRRVCSANSCRRESPYPQRRSWGRTYVTSRITCAASRSDSAQIVVALFLPVRPISPPVRRSVVAKVAFQTCPGRGASDYFDEGVIRIVRKFPRSQLPQSTPCGEGLPATRARVTWARQ